MERTWRWFGKKDKITLAQLRQIGVEGIVTALHDVPLGEVWTFLWWKPSSTEAQTAIIR